MKNLKIHVPISQYGFLEAEGELDELIRLHDDYSENPMAKNNGAWVKMKSLNKETILFNERDHIYKDEEGNKLISGSTFAKDFVKPFPKDLIAEKMAKKHKVKKENVIAQWEMSGEFARDFGTALHLSIEYHFIHRGNPFYKLPNHAFIKKVVEELPVASTDNFCIPEALLTNIKRKMAGLIDLVEVTGKKKCIIHDWKFSGGIQKSLEGYKIQINYYRKILEFAGWEVEGMIIWNYNGKWTKYEVEEIDLTKLGKKEITI